MVKKYDKAIPQKALESYITYKRTGGKSVNKKYEEIYQKVYRVGSKQSPPYIYRSCAIKYHNPIALRVCIGEDNNKLQMGWDL